MLAVHWTPVKNTKHILKNGITKSPKGLFCFPLTGHKSLDRWWVYFFNQCAVRQRKQYNGIVFRLKKDDMPAYFGSWVGATNRSVFDKPITDLRDLGRAYREAIQWRLGEMMAHRLNRDKSVIEIGKLSDSYLHYAENALQQDPKTMIDCMNDHDFMSYTFEDYQIVLSHSISADRIIKVLPQGNEFGRVLKRKKQESNRQFYTEDGD